VRRFKLRSGLRVAYIAELWAFYLTLPDACCAECAVGDTADCDVNPLKRPFTRDEIALKLMFEGECP
jgi:hypothetical protein